MRKTTLNPKQITQQELCLKQICLQTVREHVADLDAKAILDLPTSLIKDLIPHLTVCQLDELQPTLSLRGISTHSGWVRVLQDIYGPHDSIVLYTEEEAKHEAMRMLFTSKFYGFTDNVTRSIPNLNTPSILWAAAKCIKQFVLMANCLKPLQSLAAEQRPLLNLLEKRINRVGVSQFIDISERKSQIALYVLHRLLDHGMAKNVALHVRCPMLLAWLLHGRGSQYVYLEQDNLLHSKTASCISQATSAIVDSESCSLGPDSNFAEDQDVILCKRLKLESVFMEEEFGKANFTLDPQVLCQMFASPSCPSTEGCQWGQIRCLEIMQCASDSLTVLNAALPTFFCLTSLTLHSFSTFRDIDVFDLARALKQLSESPHSSLTDMSIGILPYTGFLEILLDASPKVTSLHVEIQTVMCGLPFPSHRPTTAEADLPELPLEKLTVKVAEIETDLHIITSVLRRSPHLTSVHIAGIRLPSGFSQSQLLATLSEVNFCLRSLSLEDMKLSDCLPEILHLLSNCKLEELRFNDCRLLENWTDKEENLKELVFALRAVPSLHTLSLAQNRLGRNTHVLTELFSGPSPTSVKHLNISSNFIKPADLLEFAKRLRTHHPPHRLTLDLRRNPGDRNPNTWNTVLKELHQFCVVLVEGWKSTDTMVDHISNM